LLLTQRHATGLGERYLFNPRIWASPEAFSYAKLPRDWPLAETGCGALSQLVRVVMLYGHIAYTSWCLAPTP
jgi:hypothetical protein